jgi:hypothetical protein
MVAEFERQIKGRALGRIELADQPGADDGIARVKFAAPEHVDAGADKEIEFFGDGLLEIGNDRIDIV